jgi:phosphonate transport system ATP-binding protein
MIRLDEVHVLYGTTRALSVEHLEVGPGERVFVLGHSGSGKTTLSRLIKGRLRPSTGTVRVFGEDPAHPDAGRRRAVQRRVAMIDQEYFLVPRLTAVSNVLHGSLGRVPPWRSLVGWYPSREWAKAEAVLAEVGLETLGDRRIETLSGGQRQRAAIARALMQEADVILADEPVSALDPELAEDALELLVECAARRHVTLLVNLHQPSLARRYASRFIGLADGKVVYDGPPERFTEELAEIVYRGSRSREGGADGHRAAAPVAQASGRPDIRLVRD